ncbi:hypothetical protein ACFXP3_12635, partial [Streptomyces sp. NPDC059096]
MRPLPLLAAAAVAVAVTVALVTAFVPLPGAWTAVGPSADPGTDGAARTCGRVADPEFPITTELRGGPGAYRAGGAAGEWSLDLTNTTGAACRNLHPVVVLYDRDRALVGGPQGREVWGPPRGGGAPPPGRGHTGGIVGGTAH